MSDYECVCETFEPDEAWSWTTVTTVKARKEHRCSECNEVIKVGETHEKLVGGFEGEFHSFRTCAFCAAEIQRLARAGNHVPRPGGFLACWLVAELRGEL